MNKAVFIAPSLVMSLLLMGCNSAVQPTPLVEGVQPGDLVNFEYWFTKKTGTYCAAVNLQAFGPALNRSTPMDLTVYPLNLSNADYERTGGTFLVGDLPLKVIATCFRPDGMREVKTFNALVPKDPDNLHPLVLLVKPDGFGIGIATRT